MEAGYSTRELGLRPVDTHGWVMIIMYIVKGVTLRTVKLHGAVRMTVAFPKVSFKV